VGSERRAREGGAGGLASWPKNGGWVGGVMGIGDCKLLHRGKGTEPRYMRIVKLESLCGVVAWLACSRGVR
jgi:hypothetical protein